MGRLTEWILYKIGMKQGCVLSPILFALFVAELEKCIKQLGVGAGIGGGEKRGGGGGGGGTICRLSCTASRKRADLKRLVTATNDFMTGRRLEINVAKSAVMKITQSQGQELKIEVDKGEGKETMEEVNVYKYLGFKLGNNRIFGFQMDGDMKNIKWKVASLKARAGDLADVGGGGGLTSYGIEQCDQLYCMGQKL